MLRDRVTGTPLEELEPVIDCDQLVALQDHVREIKITDELLDYIVAVVRSTRDCDDLEFGASPRGTLDLMRYSQATALLEGRDYVLPDDIKEAAPVVLAHRVIARQGSRHSTPNSAAVIEELLQALPVPV